MNRRFAAAAVIGLLAVSTSGCGSPPGERANEIGSGGSSEYVLDRLAETRPSTALVLVVNPSREAHATAFRHAAEVIARVARPDLTVVGIYQTYSIDDPYPFDRPWLQRRSSESPSPPLLAACEGFSAFETYLKHKCERENERELVDYEENAEERQRDVEEWTTEIVTLIDGIIEARVTEESPDDIWDLDDELLRAGLALQATGADTTCVLLLGGLATTPPPPNLPAHLLDGTTIVVAGWRGTPRLQSAWRSELRRTTLVFVPNDVTDALLADAVERCLET